MSIPPDSTRLLGMWNPRPPHLPHPPTQPGTPAQPGYAFHPFHPQTFHTHAAQRPALPAARQRWIDRWYYPAGGLAIAVYVAWELFQSFAPRSYTWRKDGGYLTSGDGIPRKLKRDCGVTTFTQIDIASKTLTLKNVEGGTELGCVSGIFAYTSERPNPTTPPRFDLDEVAWSKIPDLVQRAYDGGDNNPSVRIGACSDEPTELCADVGRLRFDARTGARRK